MANESLSPPNLASAPATVHVHPPQADLVPAEDLDGDYDADDSGIGDDATSSTASVASSILDYRTIQGRTYHSSRYDTNYFTPNDERQSESLDISHHYLTLMLDGDLCLSPIKEDVEKVLDVGTGTGIWAIDFADKYPNAEVIGTDLSPTQPTWVPPNLKFELDDASKPWTWSANTFDFVHMRYLFGAIDDWDALFQEAYRVCKPGGWVESCETEPLFRSDDNTAESNWGLARMNKMYREGGQKIGRTFCVIEEDRQMKGMKEAGFTDIQQFAIGGWPLDPKQREIGQYTKLGLENDIEGYTQFLWHNILDWPQDEFHVFLMEVRKAIRSKKTHAYMRTRYVYGRKPLEE